MKNHHGGMVVVAGYLYGSDEGFLTCLDFKTGELMWQDRRPGKGSIAYADGHVKHVPVKQNSCGTLLDQ